MCCIQILSSECVSSEYLCTVAMKFDWDTRNTSSAMMATFLLTALAMAALTITEVNSDVNANSGNRKLPNVIMFGTAKSGTCALVRMLGLHPDVSSAWHEPAFFNNDTKYFKLGLDFYREQMPAGSGCKKVVLEKSPYYFTHRQAPERIQEYNSSIKLILLVRDPVLRTISDYVHEGFRPNLKVKHVYEHCTRYSFEDIFGGDWKAEEGAFDLEGTTAKELHKTRMRLLRDSMYAKYLRRWLVHFPREQILVLDGDQLARNPVAVVRKTWKWLGVDPTLVPKRVFYFNETKGQYCWKMPSPSRTRSRPENVSMCLGKEKGRPHPEVNPEVVAKLRHYFEPHNKKFFKLIGKKFPAWSSPTLPVVKTDGGRTRTVKTHIDAPVNKIGD